MILIEAVCFRCSKNTEWDETIKSFPLCVDCWDMTVSTATRESYNRAKAILELRSQGKHREEIMKQLGITRRTYYYLKAAYLT